MTSGMVIAGFLRHELGDERLAARRCGPVTGGSRGVVIVIGTVGIVGVGGGWHNGLGGWTPDGSTAWRAGRRRRLGRPCAGLSRAPRHPPLPAPPWSGPAGPAGGSGRHARSPCWASGPDGYPPPEKAPRCPAGALTPATVPAAD